MRFRRFRIISLQQYTSETKQVHPSSIPLATIHSTDEFEQAEQYSLPGARQTNGIAQLQEPLTSWPNVDNCDGSEDFTSLNAQAADGGAQLPLHDLDQTDKLTVFNRHTANRETRPPIHNLEDSEDFTSLDAQSSAESETRPPIHNLEDSEDFSTRDQHTSDGEAPLPLHNLENSEDFSTLDQHTSADNETPLPLHNLEDSEDFASLDTETSDGEAPLPVDNLENSEDFASLDAQSSADSETPLPLHNLEDSEDFSTLDQHTSAEGAQLQLPLTPWPTIDATQFNTAVTPKITPRKQPVDPRIAEQVKRYEGWLAMQAKHEALHANTQEINDYIQSAAEVTQVGKKQVAIFAPFRPKLSALQTFTTQQVVWLCILALLGIIGLILFRLEMLTAVIAIITIMYFSNLVLNIAMAIRSFRHSPEEQIDDALVNTLKDADWPEYTILCPLYREASVVPQFVDAMQKLDYPPEKLQILFLTEVDDIETRNAIRALSLPSHFKIVIVPDGKPRTKPRACNYGLIRATGSYVVIYDAEDIPDPLQLKKSVLAFANHGTEVACVQAKLNFYNVYQNILTRWFTAEYSVWFDLILPGLQQTGFSLPLGGTSNHFRTAALRALGGWDAYNVTEDCDLGLRLARYHFKTVVLNSTTYEEANSQLKNWIRQRSRWIKGYMQTYLVHMRQPLEYFQKGRLFDLFSFQVVVGSGVGVLFINPLMWLLLAIYIAFGPAVVSTYHTLFPGPILYISASCLIFGNFFYIYLYLLGCMKRRQYRLVLWTLLIPFYWALISVAGFMALFELIVKPHYWQKTVHGLHLKKNDVVHNVTWQEAELAVEKEQTLQVPRVSAVLNKISDIPSVTMSLKAIVTLPVPAVSRTQKQAQHTAQRAKVRDLWLVATIVTACVASISACWYYFQMHQLLLYGDAYSHLRIARSVFDSATPGLAQLGGVWLPLPHILMFPFIWSSYLWHSGLAGSFTSMICYVAAAIYLYLSARRLTRSNSASFIGTLLFILNPNILYLQSTALSEVVCIWTSAMACYYFLVWTQEDTSRYLVLAAASTFLATLARYDGWALFLGCMALIVVVNLLKRQRRIQIIGNLTIFGVLGGLGIFLWFVWNKIIFGDPLYFQHSAFSSQAFQLQLLHSGTLYPYHNFWLSFKTYALNSMYTIGSVLFGAAILGFVAFFLRRRFSLDMLVALIFVIPFAFYVFSLYIGQAAIWVPGAVPANNPAQLYNVRYGSAMVAPAAVFFAVLVSRLSSLYRSQLRAISQIVFIVVILAQILFTTSSGIIDLQDGLNGGSCSPTHTVNAYLAQHYSGGKILEDVTAGNASESETGLNFKTIIYDGSADLWRKALSNPAGSVAWIIANRDDPSDRVSKSIDLSNPAFLAHYTLVVQEPSGLSLYHRNGDPLRSVRPIPSGILTDHRLCLRNNG